MMKNKHTALFWRGLHTFFMVMILLGLVLCWIFPIYTIVHLAGMVWMVWYQQTKGYCLLTRLEKESLKREEKHSYQGGFYQHYFFKSLFGARVSALFAKKFIIYTKVIPGYIPITYPIIKLVLG